MLVANSEAADHNQYAKLEKPEENLYILLLSTHPAGGRLTRSLRAAHQRRTDRLFKIITQFPCFIAGISEALEMLELLSNKTGNAGLSLILSRASLEIERSVEAILSKERITLNDSMRVLMEIDILLREWSHDISELFAWESATPKKRWNNFGFGALLRKQKKRLRIDDSLILPERREYETHSEYLHPSTGSLPCFPEEIEWEVSELVEHIDRVIRYSLAVCRAQDSRVHVHEDDIQTVTDSQWKLLYQVAVVLHRKLLELRLHEQGLAFPPRSPAPRDSQWVVPINKTDTSER